jgi:putative transposase
MMLDADIEIILQGAKEKYPHARPRIISDNRPQFIDKDFKEFIRISGMTHSEPRRFTRNRTGRSSVGTNRSKRECIRPGTPLAIDDARRLVQG